MQNRISSFPPLIDGQSEILILGSIPGVKSLQMQQYYAHPQNKFWKIIFELLNEEFTEDYSQRIETLKKHHIALWDVIDSCERKGSLDSEIRNEEANQIAELLEEHPNVKAIFCNGGSLTKTYKSCWEKIINYPSFNCPPQVRFIQFPLKRRWRSGREYWNLWLELLSLRVGEFRVRVLNKRIDSYGTINRALYLLCVHIVIPQESKYSMQS